LDKAKYKLCKDILRYEQDNDLTTKDIAKQLGLTIYRTEYILYSHIDKLTLDELITYANMLHIPRQLRISIPYAQKEITAKTY
jgi:predicted XRE-type DNA-binding protein